MPVARLLENSSYDPSEIQALTTAFDQVCRELGLSLRSDPLRRVVARKIFENAESGTREAKWIRAFVLAEMQGIYQHSRGRKAAA